MSDFTQEPWRIHGDSTAEEFYVYGEDGNRICTVTKPRGFYRSPKETEANARLIAAAPGAVYLAQMVLEHFKETDAPLGKMAAAWLRAIKPYNLADAENW